MRGLFLSHQLSESAKDYFCRGVQRPAGGRARGAPMAHSDVATAWCWLMPHTVPARARAPRQWESCYDNETTRACGIGADELPDTASPLRAGIRF